MSASGTSRHFPALRNFVAIGEQQTEVRRLDNAPNPVIASQRVGAKRRPMTGSAKQSIEPTWGTMDCFVAFAPRNDDG